MAIDLPQSVLSRVEFSPVEDVLIPIVRDAIPEIPVTPLIQNPQQIPAVLIRGNGSWGQWDGDMDHLNVVSFTVDAYADDPDGDQKASYLADAVKVILRDAAVNNTHVPGKGWLRAVRVLIGSSRAPDWVPSTGPVQFADLPSGAWRWRIQMQATIRPDPNFTP